MTSTHDPHWVKLMRKSLARKSRGQLLDMLVQESGDLGKARLANAQLSSENERLARSKIDLLAERDTLQHENESLRQQVAQARRELDNWRGFSTNKMPPWAKPYYAELADLETQRRMAPGFRERAATEILTDPFKWAKWAHENLGPQKFITIETDGVRIKVEKL